MPCKSLYVQSVPPIHSTDVHSSVCLCVCVSVPSNPVPRYHFSIWFENRLLFQLAIFFHHFHLKWFSFAPSIFICVVSILENNNVGHVYGHMRSNINTHSQHRKKCFWTTSAWPRFIFVLFCFCFFFFVFKFTMSFFEIAAVVRFRWNRIRCYWYLECR